eukprot:14726_1
MFVATGRPLIRISRFDMRRTFLAATQTVRDLRFAKNQPNFRVVGVLDRPTVRFETGCAAHSKLTRAHKGSEDAFFISHRSPTFYSMGVADGVAASADAGGIPALFSRTLVEAAHKFSSGRLHAPSKSLDLPAPSEIMQAAVDHIQKSSVRGSSTMCVLTLCGICPVPKHRDAGLLRASNLGDSQFMVFRDSQVVLKSPHQQHRFGLPFQLGAGPGIRGDSPDRAPEFMLPVL